MPRPQLLTRTFASPACVSQIPFGPPPASALVPGGASNSAKIARMKLILQAMQLSRENRLAYQEIQIAQCHIRARADHLQRSPGQPAQVDHALPRRAGEIEYKGRHRLKTKPPPRLLGVDFAVEAMPAARLIKCKIVRLAEQQRELHRLVIAHGLDRRVECDAGVAAATAVRPGRNAADSADVQFAPVPGDGAKENADVTGETPWKTVAGGRVDEHAQVGIGPLDVTP